MCVQTPPNREVGYQAGDIGLRMRVGGRGLSGQSRHQTGDVGLRVRVGERCLEVIVRVVQPQDRDILGGLEDARDGHTGRRRIVDRGGLAAPGEAQQVKAAAGV